MKLFLKLVFIPLIFIVLDLVSRFQLFYLYNKWQLFFYFISLFVSTAFFCLVILSLSKLKKFKIGVFSVLLFLTFFLLISFLGTYVFYSFNGFFPNFFTLLYFKTEPKSAFILLKDSISIKDSLLFLTLGIPLFFYLKYLVKQEFIRINKNQLIVFFFRICVVYIFLWIYHRKFDQCYISDVNLSINIQRHLFDFRDKKNYTGKGHRVRNPIDLSVIKSRKNKSKFNVLIVVFESMRKDRLQAYNYDRETTPFLNEFQAEHSDEFHVFEKPFTVSTTTMLAVPAILSGVGSHQEKEILYQQPLLWEYANLLDYSTFFVSSHSMQWYRFYNFYAKNKPKHFWSQENSGEVFFNDLGIDDKFTVNHLSQHIKKIKNKNFFGLIQLNSTHYPYHVPEEFQKWNETFSDSYDNSILYQDAVLAELWEVLKSEKKLENTVIFFVSDHGESLKDHSNIGHVDSYYAETISIPLMVYFPKSISKSFQLKQFQSNKTKNVSNTDIAPTIVDLLKLDSELKIKAISPNFGGYSLLRKIPKNREIITMNNNDVAKFKIGVSLIKNDFHYIWRINMVPNREELYNLKQDPKEKNNLIKKVKRSEVNQLLKGIRKHRICRKFLKKYELF